MNLNSVSFMHTINSCLSFVASFKSMHTVEEEREGRGSLHTVEEERQGEAEKRTVRP